MHKAVSCGNYLVISGQEVVTILDDLFKPRLIFATKFFEVFALNAFPPYLAVDPVEILFDKITEFRMCFFCEPDKYVFYRQFIHRDSRDGHKANILLNKQVVIDLGNDSIQMLDDIISM